MPCQLVARKRLTCSAGPCLLLSPIFVLLLGWVVDDGEGEARAFPQFLINAPQNNTKQFIPRVNRAEIPCAQRREAVPSATLGHCACQMVRTLWLNEISRRATSAANRHCGMVQSRSTITRKTGVGCSCAQFIAILEPRAAPLQPPNNQFCAPYQQEANNDKNQIIVSSLHSAQCTRMQNIAGSFGDSGCPFLQDAQGCPFLQDAPAIIFTPQAP
jgi:hypothetical protein|mmetsp:Transcript_53921/g.89800  ORF Transcript_53921/g.89800 Transcript_53921/m.89800 type:complete len:215 (+) Transcript_53921:1837-2481(+)